MGFHDEKLVTIKMVVTDVSSTRAVELHQALRKAAIEFDTDLHFNLETFVGMELCRTSTNGGPKKYG